MSTTPKQGTPQPEPVSLHQVCRPPSPPRTQKLTQDQLECQFNLADRLLTSAALFAGRSNFSLPSPNRSAEEQGNETVQGPALLEETRAGLVRETLLASRTIFNRSLASELETLTSLEALIASYNSSKPETRSSSSSKNAKTNTHKGLLRTDLQELYLGEGTDGEDFRLPDESFVCMQLCMRHKTVMDWVQKTLDQDLEEASADLAMEELGAGGVTASSLSTRSMDQEEDDSAGTDDTDSDSLSQLDEDSDSDSLAWSSSDERLAKSDEVYKTGLNDQSQSDESEDDEASVGKSPSMSLNHESPSKDRTSTSAFSLETLDDRVGSKPKSTRHRKSVVDDEFFSLAEFEQEAEQGESRMRRQLRMMSGEAGQPEDEEINDDEVELNLFKSYAPAAMDDDNDEEEDQGERMDLDSVSNIRHDDFFNPPPQLAISRRKNGASKSKSGPSPQTESKRRSPRVSFSEEVTVKSIPSKNKGLRVADMLDADEDDDEESDGSDYDDPDDLDVSDEEEGGDGSEGGSTGGDEETSQDSRSNPADSSEDSEGDVDQDHRTMNRISQDLFDDAFLNKEDSNLDEGLGSGSGQRTSKHAQRMKTLSQQIAQLEAENVAKKDWTLKGEATARDRPQNSLLEEDLEFEHIQKVAPPVTEEETLSLEALIKQRILDEQFDDVVRRRPIDTKAFLPSRLLELQDSQSSKSLAEIYEDQYRSSKAQSETGSMPMDARDQKLNEEHGELKGLFEDLCGKLDALSNAHFTPKAPKATILTLNNVPSIALESALPVGVGSRTLLAPEEIFAVESAKDVVRDKSELTHSQKQAQRQRTKEHKKKVEQKIQVVTGSKASKKDNAQSELSSKQQKEKSLRALKGAQGVTILPGKRSREAAHGNPSKHHKSRKLESGVSFKL